MKIVYPILRFFNVLLILVTLVTYVSPFVNPASFWMISIWGLFYPWLLFFNVMFVVIWLFSSRKKWALVSLSTIILGWGYLTGFIGFSSGNPSLETNQINLMSYNVNELQMLNRLSKAEKIEAFKDIQQYLSQHGSVDILCVQDLTSSNIDLFKEFFSFKNSQILGKQKVMTGIFTSYPILDKGIIRFDGSFNSCVWADLKIEDDTIRVYSVHLESNRISGEAGDVISTGNLNEETTRKKVRNMFVKYKRSTIRRSEQAAIIAEHVAGSPHPVILCGDLNDTPLSRAYRLVSAGLQDGFKEVGKGIGTTYAGGIPGLRIDYIFADSNFEILQHKILKDRVVSDHYPIFSSLIISDN